jgi:para-aminobenzoate synthetase/4-amino-4-deoxychorismate lyase
MAARDTGTIEAFLRRPGDRWLHFAGPSHVVQAYEAAQVRPVVAAVERAARDRHTHSVGFLTYEAGAAFELSVHPSPAGLPLAWFAMFDAPPTPIEHVSDWCSRNRDRYTLGPLTPTVDQLQFERAFELVKKRIRDGDTYQVNYTFRLEGTFAGDPRGLFADLVASQEGRYAAFIRMGELVICSASPELFFSRTGRQLIARPMKGTIRRGRTLAEDRERRDALRSSPKERAENVMIVDMMRNDIGRVAVVGTVAVPELLTLERYPTVWQMTSSVTAETEAPLDQIFSALHPSASVTGAPKVRTMEILRDLEPAVRGVYTGAVGYVAPGGDAQFNVAIRTAVVDERLGTVSFGVGSGIVWDSNATAEYDECLLKGAVLGRAAAAFELLETMRWTPGEGFFLLDRHLIRLQESAEYFDFRCDVDAVREALASAVSGADGPLRVRMLVDRGGRVSVQATPLAAKLEPVRAALADIPVTRDEVFLYHKTTNRALYEAARKPAADEVILWNERGEITESTIANVVVERDHARVTPPLDSGLLAGTFRAELLARGDIRESIVSIDELRAVPRFWLINSVQGWREAALLRRA